MHTNAGPKAIAVSEETYRNIPWLKPDSHYDYLGLPQGFGFDGQAVRAKLETSFFNTLQLALKAGLNLRNFRNAYGWGCVGKLRPHLHTGVLGHRNGNRQSGSGCLMPLAGSGRKQPSV